MSLLGDIKDKALEQGKTLAVDKLGDGVSSLLGNMEKAIPSREGLHPDSLRFGISLVAEQEMKKLRAREKDLVHLGEWGVTALLAELASGDEKAALLVYLQTEAGWDDLFDAVDAAREDDAQSERAHRARVATAKTILKEIGSAAKALLPFALGAVGL